MGEAMVLGIALVLLAGVAAMLMRERRQLRHERMRDAGLHDPPP